MASEIQIAENQGFSSGLFTFTEYPSDTPDLTFDDNPNSLKALDGNGVVQYPYADIREFSLFFPELDRAIHDNGSGTLIYELKQRKYKTTGLEYYLRCNPTYEGTINAVNDMGGYYVLENSVSNLSADYSGYELVDANYNTFLVTGNQIDRLTVTGDDTPTTGVFYLVDPNKNPLQISAPLKVRLLNVLEKLVPNSETAIYDYTILMQKAV